MMNAEILLDREGDLPAPPDYLVIESEVDFLRHATEDCPLLIRGGRLCAWAEAFYTLRGRPYRYQESLSVLLRRAFPDLTEEQARALVQKMGINKASLEEISAEFVLEHCYPDDIGLWRSNPSKTHAAQWLLWLYAHAPDDAERVILCYWAQRLERETGDTPEARIYQVLDSTEAKNCLYAWLGLGRDDLRQLGEFPLAVPSELLKEIKAAWTTQLIESKGAYFQESLQIPLPTGLRQELAECAAEYFQHNPNHLTRENVRHLRQYLGSDRILLLEKLLPPPEPSPLPADESAVLEWFHTEYLPYRSWQAHSEDEIARERVHALAHTFARWYLIHYPNWLLEPGWLLFQRVTRHRERARDKVVFCIVFDGLPAWDAEDLVTDISARLGRLHLLQKEYCFTSLPTVTEFAKEALLKGVPPELTSQYPCLGDILPDGSSPLNELKKLQEADRLQPGSLVFWRIGQPDTAYHFEATSNCSRKIRAELEAILLALEELVNGLSDQIPLQIIITTDHGRLLCPKSPRKLPVPNGFKAHGRVAWGKASQEFDERGFIVDESAGWAVVNGARFGMLDDMLIAWGEESFQNLQTGFETYPHGGLFPEEAIVPWFVFERDVQQPDLSISVSGKGEAEAGGKLWISITNRGPFELECIAVSLSHDNRAKINSSWKVPVLQKTEFEVLIQPWPTKAALPALRAIILLRYPNGQTSTYEITPTLEVVSLYERDDSLLKELDL